MNRLGVWLWPEDIYTAGADAVMACCQAAGITDVFLLTKGLSGKVCYHHSRHNLPTLYAGRDILREAIQAAHQRQIAVHAWFTSANDAHYFALHPEAGNAHFLDGKRSSVLRMADEGYAGYMEDILADLFATYAVDGLHLDYIRYNHLSNGWAQEDVAALTARGASVPRLRQWMRQTFYDEQADGTSIFDAYRAHDADVLALAAYRRDTVYAFAGRMIAAARSCRPRLPISAALMPEGAYPDTAFSDLHYGQRYTDAAALYDFVLPMAYHVEYGKPASWVADIAVGAVARGNTVLAGIQAYGNGTAEATAGAYDALRAMPPQPGLLGACLFRHGEPACMRWLADHSNEREKEHG